MGNLICSGKSGLYPSEEKAYQIHLQLKGEIDQLEAKTDNQIECITLNTEANTQRLDDIQEVNYSFKYGAGSSTVTQYTRVKYGNKVYGSGVDSTGLFTAPIGKFKNI